MVLQVHFRMHNLELIVRTRKGNQVYEYLRSYALQDDFLRALVLDYTHCLDVRTGFIEWRPLTNAWTSSSNWQMQPDSRGNNFLVQAAIKLIVIRSPTAKAVSAVLSPLEDAPHIHITINCQVEVLEVHLPRLELDFFVEKDALCLESKQFRAMLVDADQSLGTLTGLVSKPVLLKANDATRNIIIPNGKIEFRPDGHHVLVHVETSSAHHVQFHLYQIDNQLGRLVNNGSLKSKLFKCYLHAMTAHCVTNELTGKTGTEEALHVLATASTWSFLGLEQREIDLLELIADLTPYRYYYPQHLRVMQEAKRFHRFQNEPTNLPEVVFAGKHLLETATIRDTTYHVQEFGAEDHTTAHDVVYPAKDRPHSGPREF
ncbi:MAG: hypothetical protein M1816_002374 [Peltula sp. TS41687]|nr:MAG: hypothetical protein M1816_002374 [Peltula sp. TS41687]